MIRIDVTVIMNNRDNIGEDVFLKLDPVWVGVQHKIILIEYLVNNI